MLPVIFLACAVLLWKDQKPPTYIYIIPAVVLAALILPNPFGWEFPSGTLYVSLVATCITFLIGLIIARYWRSTKK